MIALDTQLLCQLEAVDECLVLGYVVGGLEVDLECILQPVTLGEVRTMPAVASSGQPCPDVPYSHGHGAIPHVPIPFDCVA